MSLALVTQVVTSVLDAALYIAQRIPLVIFHQGEMTTHCQTHFLHYCKRHHKFCFSLSMWSTRVRRQCIIYNLSAKWENNNLLHQIIGHGIAHRIRVAISIVAAGLQLPQSNPWVESITYMISHENESRQFNVSWPLVTAKPDGKNEEWEKSNTQKYRHSKKPRVS